MKFKKLVESFGSENTMTIRVENSLNADGCDILVTAADGSVLHKEEYRYGYNASHSRKWAEWYPEKPYMKDIIDGLCAKYDIAKSDIIFKCGANVFAGCEVTDAAVREFKNNYVESLTETYWIDSADVMAKVDELGKELEADGFKYYGDRYSGSTYYNLFTKRGDNGAICKAVQYNYDGAQIIDVTVDQVMGYKPIDRFEKMRKDLGRVLLPQHEDMNDGKDEDQFVLYFPYSDPKIINKERAIKQLEFELDNIKNDSGSRLAGRGFGIYCLQSVDADTGTTYTGRYSSKEFLNVLHEDIKNESFEMAAGGDDFDGEIGAMRAEQKELEARRAARKERFALMHKLFDKHMNADPNAKWIDKIYDLFEDAEKVMFIGNKYGTLPGKTEDGQPIKYRYSIEEYNIYTDPYREFVYITTNKNDPSESLNEDTQLKLFDDDMINDIDILYQWRPEEVEKILVKHGSNPNNDTWDTGLDLPAAYDEIMSTFRDKYSDYDEIDYNVAKVLGLAEESLNEDWRDGKFTEDDFDLLMDEDVNKQQYVICGVTNEGTRMLYDAVNDNFTTDYASATKYDDMEVARDDWFKIPRSGFRRIFIPVYDPAVFESVKEAFDADKVQKRIACTTEFDNGHVFHNDYFRASAAEAEERAKQASIENPDKVFYVKYDDVMNPSSDIKWKNGEQLNEADEPIYFDPDDESEVDFRYYVYANNDDVVSDAFDFEEDAISWAQENNYPIVKIHNYYRDTDGELNPDGDPKVVWEA